MKVGLQTPSSQNQRDQRSRSIPRPDSPDERRTRHTHKYIHTKPLWPETRLAQITVPIYNSTTLRRRGPLVVFNI